MSVEEIPQGANVSILSKNEKKARELVKKLGLKQVKGITRVTFKQRGNLIYAIDQPDVYRSAAGTYVVFGEATVDDMNKRIAEAQQQQQAQQQAAGKEGAEEAQPAEGEVKSQGAITADLERAAEGEKPSGDADDEEVDESGLDPKDIDIIIEQTHVSRGKAAKALRKHDGDMVNAIMELS